MRFPDERLAGLARVESAGFLKHSGEYVGMLTQGVKKLQGFNFIVPIRRIHTWAKEAKIEWAIDPGGPMPTFKEIDAIPVEDQFVGTLEGALTLWRKLTLQNGRMDEMLDGVEAYRKEAGADVVVYGHTHEPGHIGDYHLNAGTWARTNDTFVRINDDGRTAVWEWLPSNRPAPFSHALR